MNLCSQQNPSASFGRAFRVMGDYIRVVGFRTRESRFETNVISTIFYEGEF